MVKPATSSTPGAWRIYWKCQRCHASGLLICESEPDHADLARRLEWCHFVYREKRKPRTAGNCQAQFALTIRSPKEN